MPHHPHPQVGRSHWSLASSATTSAAVPARPPRPLVGTITRSSANFSWQPLADDGGSPVVDYRVRREPLTLALPLPTAAAPACAAHAAKA